MTIVSIIWGVVSFFVSLFAVISLYPLFSVLLNLFSDGMTKIVVYLGIYLTVFAVTFLVPYNIIVKPNSEEEQ